MSIGKHARGPWIGIVDGVFVTDNPWSIDHCEGHDNTCAAIGDSHGNVVALVVSDDERPGKDRWDDCELEANAHLIAAAPDLLDALETLVLFSKPTKTNAVALNHAYEVIAKARGEA